MIFDIVKVNKLFPITGIIHIGGFNGDELDIYRNIGLYNTIMFEPQPSLYNIIKDRCIENEKVYNLALGSEPCEKDMYVSWRDGGVSNGCGASSSLLKPKKHLEEHKDVYFPESMITKIKVDILDNYYELGYNFLNIDVQGYELEVLKGAINSIPKIDAMILEVNRDEVYESCPMVEDLDTFLSDFGFSRISTIWQSESWGDALYAKL